LDVKEVNLRKFLVLLFIVMLLSSLSAFAKDAFSFEPYEYPDSVLPSTDYEGMEPFITGYRDSKPEDFSIVEGKKWWHGTHSVQISMTHEAIRWNIMAKNKRISGQVESLDTTFLTDLDYGDTIYYYLYIPWNAHIDSIFIFVRNYDWDHEEHTVYHTSDLHYGRWNELKDGISRNNTAGDPFDKIDSIIQSDFEIHTSPLVNPPACTLYWDAPSSKGRVPPRFTDTTGQAGVEMPEQGAGAVTVTKGSINCVEYSINASEPVIVQVFDLTGRKQLEIPVGMQSAGTYSIPLNLRAGVYITRVAAITGEATGKVICVK
jgi:hypothetical protein